MSSTIIVGSTASIETRLADTICKQNSARHPPPPKKYAIQRRRLLHQHFLRLQAEVDSFEGDDSEAARQARERLEFVRDALMDDPEAEEAEEAEDVSWGNFGLDPGEAPGLSIGRTAVRSGEEAAIPKIKPVQDGYQLTADEETLVRQTTDDMVLALLKEIRTKAVVGEEEVEVMMMQFLETLDTMELEEAIVLAAVFIVELNHKMKTEMDTRAKEDQALICFMTITLCQRLESRFVEKGKESSPDDEWKKGKGKEKVEEIPSSQENGKEWKVKGNINAEEDIPLSKVEAKNLEVKKKEKDRAEAKCEEILSLNEKEILKGKGENKENIPPLHEHGEKLNGKGKGNAEEEVPATEESKQKSKEKGKEKSTEESPSSSKSTCRAQ